MGGLAGGHTAGDQAQELQTPALNHCTLLPRVGGGRAPSVYSVPFCLPWAPRDTVMQALFEYSLEQETRSTHHLLFPPSGSPSGPPWAPCTAQGPVNVPEASPAVHGVHHPPRDLHLPQRSQHALSAVGPAGQADDKHLEEAGGRGGRGEAAGGGESPPPDLGPAGREDSPHQTPSCWASLGAGTHEPRPTWGAHPLQRKARCHESPLAQVSGTLESQAPLIPAPLAGCPVDHRPHLPPLLGGAD